MTEDSLSLLSAYGARCPYLSALVNDIIGQCGPNPAVELENRQRLALYRLLCELLHTLRNREAPAQEIAAWLYTRPRFRFRTCRLWLAVMAYWSEAVPPADELAERIDIVSRRADANRVECLFADLRSAEQLETDYRQRQA